MKRTPACYWRVAPVAVSGDAKGVDPILFEWPMHVTVSSSMSLYQLSGNYYRGEDAACNGKGAAAVGFVRSTRVNDWLCWSTYFSYPQIFPSSFSCSSRSTTVPLLALRSMETLPVHCKTEDLSAEWVGHGAGVDQSLVGSKMENGGGYEMSYIWQGKDNDDNCGGVNEWLIAWWSDDGETP